MTVRYFSTTLVLVGFVATAGPVAVVAGPVAGARTCMPAAVSEPEALHRCFGLLARVNGFELLLRLRDGRVLRINASDAFARNRVSQPLFVGKSTVVEGNFAADGIFRATAVKRAAPRPLSWGIDR